VRGWAARWAGWGLRGGGPGPVRDTFAAGAEAAPGVLRAANLTVVSGMGGDPARLAVPEADELRLYHAGLASDADLAELGRQLAALGRD